ncbi:dihydrodipicolinate synthase [Colletotrichum asianum]
MERAARALPRGIFAASMSFFDKTTESIDTQTQRQHPIRLSEAGIVGFVVMGSNGEAPHLSIEERNTIIRETRDALDSIGKQQTPIIAGCSEHSVRGTVHLCNEASRAGTDYALVLPPSYFSKGMSPEVIESFFTDVADHSPIPIILYSFPAVSAGIEMDSGLLNRISQHPNVAGTKFTCGDTGKLSRVSTAMKSRQSYALFGGLADFTLPALVAGATGVIAGGANVAPRTCVQVFDLWQEGLVEEAREMQAILAKGDWEHTARGISGTKAALNDLFGYGGSPRRPLKMLSEASLSEMRAGSGEMMAVEERLWASSLKTKCIDPRRNYRHYLLFRTTPPEVFDKLCIDAMGKKANSTATSQDIKKLRNRLSQQAFRRRRDDLIRELRERADNNYTNENEALAKLRRENTALREQLAEAHAKLNSLLAGVQALVLNTAPRHEDANDEVSITNSPDENVSASQPIVDDQPTSADLRSISQNDASLLCSYPAVIDWLPFPSIRDCLVRYYAGNPCIDQVVSDVVSMYAVETLLSDLVIDAPPLQVYVKVMDLVQAMGAIDEDSSERPAPLLILKVMDIFNVPSVALAVASHLQIETRLDRYKLDPRLFIRHPEFLESAGSLMAHGAPLQPD